MRQLRRVDFPLEFVPRSCALALRLGRAKALAILERAVDEAVRPLGCSTAGHGFGDEELGVVVELPRNGVAHDLDRIVMRSMESAAAAALVEIGAAA